jgi:hypothetical protein
MGFRRETGSRGLQVTKTEYGVSIRIRDTDPETRYLPPDHREVSEAVKNAKVERTTHG